MTTHKFYRYWAPVIVYAALIFASSSVSKPPVEVELPYFDKVTHFFMYSLLGYLLLRALVNYEYDLSKTQMIFLAIFLGALYGISDEIHQYFVPERIACVSDAVFDFFGSAVGTFIYNYKVKYGNY